MLCVVYVYSIDRNKILFLEKSFKLQISVIYEIERCPYAKYDIYR